MQAPFAKPIKDREEARKILFPMGLAWHVCWFLGCVFALLGLIGGAMKGHPWLGAASLAAPGNCCLLG
ncbi:unnamed protein product [marine sediment metagenome]|uniref:Uncharacterized protein n=1 Tax=marine sediment metagenome TaxID=412755 RepID=X1G1K7_9ZZZZ